MPQHTIRTISATSIVCDKSSAKLRARLTQHKSRAQLSLELDDADGGYAIIGSIFHPDNTYLRRLAAAINGEAAEPDDRAEFDPERESLP